MFLSKGSTFPSRHDCISSYCQCKVCLLSQTSCALGLTRILAAVADSQERSLLSMLYNIIIVPLFCASPSLSLLFLFVMRLNPKRALTEM